MSQSDLETVGAQSPLDVHPDTGEPQCHQSYYNTPLNDKQSTDASPQERKHCAAKQLHHVVGLRKSPKAEGAHHGPSQRPVARGLKF